MKEEYLMLPEMNKVTIKEKSWLKKLEFLRQSWHTARQIQAEKFDPGVQ